MTIEWWRSWHGAPTDNKWLLIGRRAGVAPGIVSAIVWALFDYASQNNERGSIANFDTETYAEFSGFSETDITAVIEALHDKHIIDDKDHLTAWDKRQPKREDNSAERVREHRARRDVTRRNAEKQNVTQRNAEKQNVTLDTDTDTDIDPDIEIDPTPPTRDSRDIKRAPLHRGNGGGGVGITFPPEDLSAEQAAAWELLLAAAPDFNSADEFIRSQPAWLIGEWALALDESQAAKNPAGVIRSGVINRKRPMVTTPLHQRWQARKAYWEQTRQPM